MWRRHTLVDTERSLLVISFVAVYFIFFFFFQISKWHFVVFLSAITSVWSTVEWRKDWIFGKIFRFYCSSSSPTHLLLSFCRQPPKFRSWFDSFHQREVLIRSIRFSAKWIINNEMESCFVASRFVKGHKTNKTFEKFSRTNRNVTHVSAMCGFVHRHKESRWNVVEKTTAKREGDRQTQFPWHRMTRRWILQVSHRRQHSREVRVWKCFLTSAKLIVFGNDFDGRYKWINLLLHLSTRHRNRRCCVFVQTNSRSIIY